MHRPLLHYGVVLAAAVVGGALVWPSAMPPRPVNAVDLPQAVLPAPAAAPAPEPESAPVSPARAGADTCQSRPLVTPSGGPPRVTCRAARAIVAEMHARFAGDPRLPPARDFGKLTTAWLDPHGLW